MPSIHIKHSVSSAGHNNEAIKAVAHIIKGKRMTRDDNIENAGSSINKIADDASIVGEKRMQKRVETTAIDNNYLKLECPQPKSNLDRVHIQKV
jgi:hypothetical protein